MERCPACRSRLGDTPICPRCGCDFTLAILAESQAQLLICRAIQARCRGDHDMAEACIGASLALKRGGVADALAKKMFCLHEKQTWKAVDESYVLDVQG